MARMGFGRGETLSAGARMSAPLLLAVLAILVVSAVLPCMAPQRADALVIGTSSADAGIADGGAVLDDGLYNASPDLKPALSLSIAGESPDPGALTSFTGRDMANWSQKWLVVKDSASGFYTIRNLRSRMLLTVKGKIRKGADVKQAREASGGASKRQLWRVVKDGKRFEFRPASSAKLSLSIYGSASNGYKASLKKARSARSQLFCLRKAEPIESGRSYYVRNAANVKQAVAVKGASRKEKARLALEARSSAASQKFRLESTGTAYTVQCVRSCQFATASKGAVRQFKSSKGKARKWRISLDMATGTFTICSVSSGRYLDAAQGKLALRAESKASARRFALIPTYGFTVFIDAGHGKNAAGWGVYDPGAEGSGYDEADLTKGFAARIASKLEGSDVRVFNGSDYSVPYWQRNAKAKSLGCDAVLSVHFDVGGGSSTATMVGTHGKAAGSDDFNAIIHRKLVSSTGLADGGTMHRGDITVVNGSVPAVLMEVCFIDNSGSLKKFLDKRDQVAESLAEGIVEASKLASLHR